MMTPINVELLVAAEVLYEEFDYGRAAQKLGITESLLKSRIAALQAHLDFHLFVTQGKRVKVTPQGHAFINAARDFLLEMKRIKSHQQRE